MRFHIVSLPHTQTTYDYEACAYTAKQRKLSNMLHSLGHTVYLYSGEENEANCSEHVTVVTKEQQRKWFGSIDFHKTFFNIGWDPNAQYWLETNAKAITEINRRIKPGDMICLVGGRCQEQIGLAFSNNKTIESGIGYEGTFSRYRVFESYAWMHYVYGRNGNDNGIFNDVVIPNYFEPQRFPFRKEKDDFFLYLGRFVKRKGIEIAAEVTRLLGEKLVIAGQGVTKHDKNTIYGEDFSVSGKHILHLGFADVKMRGELLSRARAVFTPTTYLEPFGGVSIEAMLCGTPVIATDFGAFPENVRHGKDGFRFRTFGEALWAAKNVDALDKKAIRRYAVKNFSVNRIKYLYQAYFEQIQEGEDFYQQTNMNNVNKYHRYTRF